MTPQLSVQQLEHAIKNLQKRVDAKKLEAHSYGLFRDHAPAALEHLCEKFIDEDPAIKKGLADPPGEYLHDATENLFTAKLNQALIDLEELELQLKAVKQMSSGILVPGMQINQNKR
jgi:hypothetical protein